MYKATLSFHMPNAAPEFEAAYQAVAIHQVIQETSDYLASQRSFGEEISIDLLIDTISGSLMRQGLIEMADSFGVAPETGLGEPE